MEKFIFGTYVCSEEVARGVLPKRPLFPDSHSPYLVEEKASTWVSRYMMSLIYLYYSAATMLAYVVA